MMGRIAATRIVTLATLAALGAALVGTTAAEARKPPVSDRHLELTGDRERETARLRPFRRVDVSSLPEATGDHASNHPVLRGPSGARPPAAPSTGILVAPAPVLATASGDPAPTQATSYPGFPDSSGPTTIGEPPDPSVAVGPDHVFQAVNNTFRISNRAGIALRTVSMWDFFGLSSIPDYDAAVFDPRVIYDSLHGRWIAIEGSFDCYEDSGNGILFGTGYVDLAISDGPNPMLGWSVLSLPYYDASPDLPALGTSTDKVVVSPNLFILGPGGNLGCEPNYFIYTHMDIMAWSQLQGTGKVDVDRIGVNFDWVTWRPAVQTPATSSTVFAIGESPDGSVAYMRITGDPSGAGSSLSTPINLSSTDIIAPFALPPAPQQPVDMVIADAVNERPTDAVWKNNKLAFVSTYPCDVPGGVAEDRDCVRVSELSTATPSAPTKVQDFLVGANNFDLYMGGIGYALNDDLHVVWTRSSEAAPNYPSAYSAYQSAAAPVNTLSERALLSPGLGTYPGDRWGDYVGVAQDPQVPNAVWQGNEFSDPTTGWATQIVQLQTGGSSYVPITPLRVLDTRPAYHIGLTGGFTANVPRSWQVNTVGTIPADAIAVTGNVTVVNQTASGYVSITAAATANPTSSTINFPTGDTRANNLTVPVGADGKLAAVFKAPAGQTTHLIFDVTGYFLAGDTHGTYAPLAPVRILDSRPAYNIGLTGAFVPNIPRQVSVAGGHGIPADAVAITGNLTVVGQTKAGYLSITPDADSTPDTSTLNFPLGDTRANGVTVPLNGAGTMWIVYKASGGTTHVILDVTGYYLNDPSGLLFYPLTPGRLMDTRPIAVMSRLSGAFAANVSRTLKATSHWGIPASANAITGNLTVVGQTAAGYASITLNPTASPTTSTINFPLGDTRANGATVPLNGTGSLSFVYKAPGGKTTHLIFDVSGYFD